MKEFILGPYPKDTPMRLQIEKAPNGGFVVSEPDRVGTLPKIVGAFSTAEDMLSSLATALKEPTQ